MHTRAIVLVLELDEIDGNPMDWNWSEMLDIPGQGYVAMTTQLENEPSEAEVDRFVKLTRDYEDKLKELFLYRGPAPLDPAYPQCAVCDKPADRFCLAHKDSKGTYLCERCHRVTRKSECWCCYST